MKSVLFALAIMSAPALATTVEPPESNMTKTYDLADGAALAQANPLTFEVPKLTNRLTAPVGAAVMLRFEPRDGSEHVSEWVRIMERHEPNKSSARSKRPDGGINYRGRLLHPRPFIADDELIDFEPRHIIGFPTVETVDDIFGATDPTHFGDETELRLQADIVAGQAALAKLISEGKQFIFFPLEGNPDVMGYVTFVPTDAVPAIENEHAYDATTADAPEPYEASLGFDMLGIVQNLTTFDVDTGTPDELVARLFEAASAMAAARGLSAEQLQHIERVRAEHAAPFVAGFALILDGVRASRALFNPGGGAVSSGSTPSMDDAIGSLPPITPPLWKDKPNTHDGSVSEASPEAPNDVSTDTPAPC